MSLQKIGGIEVKDVWGQDLSSMPLLQVEKGKVYELCKYPQIRYIQRNYEYTLATGI